MTRLAPLVVVGATVSCSPISFKSYDHFNYEFDRIENLCVQMFRKKKENEAKIELPIIAPYRPGPLGLRSIRQRQEQACDRNVGGFVPPQQGNIPDIVSHCPEARRVSYQDRIVPELRSIRQPQEQACNRNVGQRNRNVDGSVRIAEGRGDTLERLILELEDIDRRELQEGNRNVAQRNRNIDESI